MLIGEPHHLGEHIRYVCRVGRQGEDQPYVDVREDDVDSGDDNDESGDENVPAGSTYISPRIEASSTFHVPPSHRSSIIASGLGRHVDQTTSDPSIILSFSSFSFNFNVFVLFFFFQMIDIIQKSSVNQALGSMLKHPWSGHSECHRVCLARIDFSLRDSFPVYQSPHEGAGRRGNAAGYRRRKRSEPSPKHPCIFTCRIFHPLFTAGRRVGERVDRACVGLQFLHTDNAWRRGLRGPSYEQVGEDSSPTTLKISA